MNKNIALDFDGTIVKMFNKSAMNHLCAELKTALASDGYTASFNDNAFDVFFELQAYNKYSETKSAHLMKRADCIITDYEMMLVKNCEIINGAEEIIPKLIEQKINVGIVTNNSEACVSRFLENVLRLDLPVIGRDIYHIEKLKPNAYPVIKLSEIFSCMVSDMVLVGDSKKDLFCAKNAGCRFMGMAKDEVGKERFLRFNVGQEWIVKDFFELGKRVTE